MFYDVMIESKELTGYHIECISLDDYVIRNGNLQFNKFIRTVYDEYSRQKCSYWDADQIIKHSNNTDLKNKILELYPEYLI